MVTVVKWEPIQVYAPSASETISVSVKERVDLTEEELDLLEKLVYGEAGDSTIECQTAVAAVVLNRLESDIFPDTITEVICQKGAFDSELNQEIYTNGEKVTNEMVDESTVKLAVEKALRGEDPTYSEKYGRGAWYFYMPGYLSAAEEELRKGIVDAIQIGSEVFFYIWSE